MASIKGSAAAEVFVRNRKGWRQWLTRHHATERSIWLVIRHKASTTRGVTYDEAVEEALCFGWVDSTARSRDTDSYVLRIARRNPRSLWSRRNRERVERLVGDGAMTPAGMAVVDLAKTSGTWNALEPVQKAIIPDDLMAALGRNAAARKHFNAFPPSSKRIILEWILNAKKAETRKKRIRETVTLAAKNIRANHPVMIGKGIPRIAPKRRSISRTL